MGWREGTVHAVILGAQLKSSDAPTCDQLDRDTAGANRAYAVVRTRVGRPSTDFIVPVPADRELQVGDRVMANRSSCAPVVVLRSVHVGEASGASGN